MNIVSTQYTLSTKSVEIYLAGCNGQPKCKNCHNPELWNFNIGNDWRDSLDDIIKKCKEFEWLVKNIMIFGGEPLDQDLSELKSLLAVLNELLTLDIWIFTRYSLNEVPSGILDYCDYIKCGRYEETLLVDNNIQYGIKLATSNQNIYKKGKDYN